MDRRRRRMGPARADSHYSGSYPHALKKAAASSGVMASMASRIASHRSSTVRAAARLRSALILAKAISIDGVDGSCSRRPLRHAGVSLSQLEEASMFEVSTVGVDLAKNVIQVHGVDAVGKTMVRRQLRRSQFLAFFEGRPRCSDRHGSVLGRPPLGSAAAGDGSRGSADAAVLCEALRQARKDGRGRCRGDLRGRHAAIDAVRPREE